MKDKEVFDTTLKVVKRAKNGDYLNLYIDIDGYNFELVPHCRSKKETALFYAVLKRSKLFDAE